LIGANLDRKKISITGKRQTQRGFQQNQS